MLPKTIHYCWFGGGEKSELILRCIDSWKRYAPECEIREWNEQNYDISKNIYMRQAFDAGRWGFVPDYARLDIIYDNGGIYLDTDVELIRPLDELLEGTGFCGFEFPAKAGFFCVNTGSGFGAEKHDQVIKIMRDYYDALSFVNDDGTLNLQPSPQYNTAALQSLGLKGDNSMQRIGNITIYPWEYFCPVDWKTHKRMVTSNTYSIHHFDASWLSEHEKRLRKRARVIDSVIHMPNRMAMTILGAEKYEQLKGLVKREK